MLRSVLDEGITRNIVRLGSRSSDERISEFSIENVENVAGRSRLTGPVAGYRRALRDVEAEIKKFMDDFFKTQVDAQDIMRYLTIQSPVLLDSIQNPPGWTQAVYSLQQEEQGDWHVAGANGKDAGQVDLTLYGFWLAGADINFLNNAHYNARYRADGTAPSAEHRQAANRFDILQAEAAENNDEESSDDAATDSGRESDVPSDGDIEHAALENAAPEEEWLNAMFPEAPNLAETASPASMSNIPHAAIQSPSSPVIPGPADTAFGVHSGTIHPDDFVNLREFFAAFGCPEIPHVPAGARPVDVLLAEDDAWAMSAEERARLHKAWSDEVRVTAQEAQTAEFRRLREKHARAAQEYLEGQAEVRYWCPKSKESKELMRLVYRSGSSFCATLTSSDALQLVCYMVFGLSSVSDTAHIRCCKAHSALEGLYCRVVSRAELTVRNDQGIGPKVLLVEEAGQVLEAHILGSLVPSIQHLVLIGDPLQLRPTLNNYCMTHMHDMFARYTLKLHPAALSMDHPHGKLIYKFDMSLMERLSSSGLPMSQINVQRRMRPEVADLVRYAIVVPEQSNGTHSVQ